MAKTAWRCSECGTLNEAGARACGECGRWPSLFDLQDSVAEEADLEGLREPEFEVEEFELETFETNRGASDEPERATDRRRRLVRSLIVPLALLVYLVVSLLSDR